MERKNKSIERKRENGRKQLSQSYMKKNKNFNNKDYKHKNQVNRNNELYYQIRTAILNILEDLRNNYKQHIDANELKAQFIPIIHMSEEVVYDVLENFSFHEQYYSSRSVKVWTYICDALEDIKTFDRAHYREIVYNVEFIKKNQDIFD